jgi:hypothetical protein
MPGEKSKRLKAAEGMRKAFSESFIEKLKKNMPKVFGNEKAEEKNKIKPKGAKDFLSKSLQERRGR